MSHLHRNHSIGLTRNSPCPGRNNEQTNIYTVVILDDVTVKGKIGIDLSQEFCHKAAIVDVVPMEAPASRLLQEEVIRKAMASCVV